MDSLLKQTKKWLGEIIEISLLLISVGVVVEILFGTAVPLFGGVVTNLVEMIGTLGENGLAGLIALSVILFLFYNRERVAA
jgi:hypothetical protein